ncbi:hypothetical protein PYCCODRAFT_630071 [Trametes coccinea BRFM310]|uniref:Uncharacterized protein n=1 Tax=Trametes coccinea (strain BRFM310) TaxID=1353009 RepID=A0A1Y2J474_TRAC3|nr:hypothetical protein PYCCODRAFT_630071 [Trametes coccinea BRFM310]
MPTDGYLLLYNAAVAPHKSRSDSPATLLCPPTLSKPSRRTRLPQTSPTYDRARLLRRPVLSTSLLSRSTPARSPKRGIPKHRHLLEFAIQQGPRQTYYPRCANLQRCGTRYKAQDDTTKAMRTTDRSLVVIDNERHAMSPAERHSPPATTRRRARRTCSAPVRRRH